MTNCNLPQHENHTHPHGLECGHTALVHDDHVCYLHDGTFTIRTAITRMNMLSA